MNNILDKYKITILRPGGNDTALVKGIVKKEKRILINNKIMEFYPNVEQVGFYNYDPVGNVASLEMAGGEFCGNAIRSLAFLLLNGERGEINFKVSGTNQLLQAGVKNKNRAYAYMPIYNDLNCVKKLRNDLFIVNLEGITHLINFYSGQYSQNEYKKKARQLLKNNNLLSSCLAAGVMFVTSIANKNIVLNPVVWVRDIETLFYETACASGTTALALCISKIKKNSYVKITVTQPSRQNIEAFVARNKNQFLRAFIDGPVEILKEYD